MFEPPVRIPVQQPFGVPSLAIPIIFGWAGAWWASNKAAKLGVADTGRYWKAGIISSISVAMASVLVPFAIVSLLGLALFSANTTAVNTAISGISSAAPRAEGIDPAPTSAASQAPSAAPGGAATVPLDQAKVGALMQKITANPKDLVSLAALGDLYFASSDYKNAAVFEQKVVTVDPKNEKGLIALGAAQFNLGNHAEAKKSWIIAAGLYPNNAEVHYDLGFLYMSQTPPDSANMQAEWKKVVAIDPNSALAKTVATHLK